MGYTYYTYRPDDLRHSIGNTVHVWSGTNIVADIKGGTTTVYFRGIGLIFAETSGTRTYYHQNAHGDVIMLTDGTGTILTTYEYDAFGREWDALDTDNNPFRYCGEYFDRQTKTVYLRARYYDSAYGRFTQQDGWQYADANDPLSLNLYTYCWNNPVMYTDYSGNFPILAAAMAISTVSLLIHKLTEYTENYDHNSALYSGTGYINGQEITPGVKDCRLGFQKVSENGCEAIAIYNAMVAMENPQSFADVIDYCEDSMWLLGYFGTHWETIPEYFKQFGIHTEVSQSVDDYQRILQENGYGIFTFWTEKGDITKGIHTVFIEYVSESEIIVYNRYSNNEDARVYANLDSMIESGNLDGIQFVGISNRKLPPKDTVPPNTAVYALAR